jgi:hypothetical protein
MGWYLIVTNFKFYSEIFTYIKMFIILLHGSEFVLSSPGLIMTETLTSHFEIRNLGRILTLVYAEAGRDG